MSVRSAIGAGRRLMASSFVDTATIADKMLVADGRGGKVAQWVPRAESLPCRFTKLTDNEQSTVAMSSYGPATGVVIFPIGTEVEEGAQVWNAQGRQFHVFGQTTPPGEAAVGVRVLIREA